MKGRAAESLTAAAAAPARDRTGLPIVDRNVGVWRKCVSKLIARVGESEAHRAFVVRHDQLFRRHCGVALSQSKLPMATCVNSHVFILFQAE